MTSTSEKHPEIIGFDWQPGKRIIYGPGEVERLGGLVREIAARRVLLVTDPGVAAAGHQKYILEILETDKLDVFVFNEVIENPTDETVATGVDFARRAGGIEAIIGLGGGSAMDCAKGINFLLSNGGNMEDYWGYGKAARPMLPSIGIPTTAGTGSEAQSFALISRSSDHRKMACGDPKARFHTVVLDPRLLRTIPLPIAGISAIDAVTHALESYVCTRSNAVSRLFGREAWRLLNGSFDDFLENPADETGAGRMLLGAHYAGLAIENAMLGAAHATANPLTAMFEITHGIAVGLMMPHVIRMNAALVDPFYRELLRGDSRSPSETVDYLVERLHGMLRAAGLPQSLQEVGVVEADIEGLTAAALLQWTAAFNPVPLNTDNITRLYQSAL